MTVPRAPASWLDAALLGRHQLAAFSTAALDFGLMIAIVETLDVSPPAATMVSALFGALTNFTLSRVWAYRERHAGTLWSQAARYAAVSAGGALLNAGTLALVLAATPAPYVAARLVIAALVSVLYTYPLHTRIVFRVDRDADAHTDWLRTAGLVAPFAGYVLYAASRSELRFEHVAMAVLATALALAGPRARELLAGLLPFGLVAIVYDAMRPIQRAGVTASRVMVCDLRAVESRLFGWGSGGERFTLHDFFRAHHWPALDLLCAIPYATFLLWCVAGAVYLYVEDRPAMRRFGWGFFLLNLLGFVTYHLLPAAPPWYFHAHGCGVDLFARASEGPVLARVDARLGIGFFHGMYARASSVFGALPSLHCAYPILLAIEGFRAFGRPMRVAAVGYAVAMIFSAVYLDHHWVLDAVLGATYAVVASTVVRRFLPRPA